MLQNDIRFSRKGGDSFCFSWPLKIMADSVSLSREQFPDLTFAETRWNVSHSQPRPAAPGGRGRQGPGEVPWAEDRRGEWDTLTPFWL